jgi:hypothetical protein
MLFSNVAPRGRPVMPKILLTQYMMTVLFDMHILCMFDRTYLHLPEQ